MSALFPRLCSLFTTKTRRKKRQLLTENAELKRRLQDQETALWIAEALLTVRRATTPAPPLPVTDDDGGTVQTDTPLVPDVAAVEPMQESTVEPVPVIQPPKTAAAYLADIKKQASRKTTPEDLDCLIREMLDFYPDMKDAAQNARKQGQSILDALNNLYHLARKHGRDAAQVKDALHKFCQQHQGHEKQAHNQVANGHQARGRNQEHVKRQQSGFVPIITPRQIPRDRVTTPRIAPGKPQTPAAIRTSPLHAQDIRGLQPAANWTLIIDETGKAFGESAQQLNTRDRLLGRWVGLLIPASGHGLPRLPAGWHATEQGSLDEIDRVFQCVLDANVGVLGLTVKQVSATTGELWATGVLNLIDWVLRLLPLDGPAKIQVSIENRDSFKKMEWPALARDALRRLSIAYPERARRISMDIKVEDKWTQPCNGYVDVLAFTWGSPAESSKLRLAASKLLGHCFLEGNARQILDAWEWLDRGIRIRPEDWTHLLAQPDVQVEGGLTATILQRLGESCRQDVGVWRGFADEVRRHLDSKAVDLYALGSQVEWLEQYRPGDEVMSPRLRLLWLTTQLASANHLGAVQQPWMREIEVLANRLMEEDAPLVCWADLHLAVNATNRFDFGEASRCLNRWRDVPCSVPGLRYWSQACSSLGQHAAFTGNYVMAKEGFQAALNGFAGLSEETMRQKNITQTATYLAIVEMDHGSDEDARRSLEQVMGSGITDAIHRLAVSNASNDKYLHHLLVRWLAYRGNQTERDSYLGYRNKWQTEYGHPWPLIQLYRGVLLHPLDPQAAADLAEGAYQLAMDVEQGPTVRLIGCCCRAVAQSWGRDWPEGQQRLDELESRLPAAKTCIDGLRQYLQEPASQNPLDMLARVLPFNFH